MKPISFSLMALCLIILPYSSSSQNLNSLISLSELLASGPPTSTSGNVNIIDLGNNNTTLICYMPYLFFFTTSDGPNNAIGSFDGLAAIALAMEHLNTGDGTIIPQVEGINERCPLRFTTKSFDTETSQRVGVDHLIEMTDRSNMEQLVPCAILGAAYSSISIPTSIISGLRGFPQISPVSTSASLDDASQFKLFGRTIPNDDGTAIPLLEMLAYWNVNYLAVIHVDDAYGNAFANGIQVAAQRDYPNLRVQTVDVLMGASDGQISEAVKKLKDTQFQYFFGILFSQDLDRIMTEAYEQGIAGTGLHTWLFSDGVGSYVASLDFPRGSTLEKAYRGTGVLKAAGGVPGIETFDKLARSMRQLSESEEDLAFLDAHLPATLNHSSVTDDSSFLRSTPGLASPFLYDAVIGLGLASCRLIETSADDSDYFGGEELFQAFLNTTFDGTSGTIILDEVTGTRDPRSALFSLSNFVDDEDANAGPGMMRFKEVETDLFKSGKRESLHPYTFNDGTNQVPLDIPVLETNSNYLSTGLKVVGLILCGTIVALALGFSYWTYHNKHKRVVRSSQPIFLLIISTGTLLSGLSIIPLTVDLGVTNQEGADAACMAFAWLLTIGFSLTFSALFTKTYRINQLIQNSARCRRVKLTAADVMKPLITLLMLNIIVLSLWTAIDPMKHETVVVEVDPFLRSVETYGACTSDNATVFLASLCVINIGSLLYALFQAYRARNISTEFQESSYIFIAMSLILFVSFIGIPVMVLARENTSAFYFVTAALIFVMCISIQVLIFVPKVKALRTINTNTTNNTNSIVRRNNSNEVSTLDRASSVEDGMKITAQVDLERENSELKKEILELKQLMSKERNPQKGIASNTSLTSEAVTNGSAQDVKFRDHDSLILSKGQLAGDDPGRIDALNPHSSPCNGIDKEREISWSAILNPDE